MVYDGADDIMREWMNFPIIASVKKLHKPSYVFVKVNTWIFYFTTNYFYTIIGYYILSDIGMCTLPHFRILNNNQFIQKNVSRTTACTVLCFYCI